MSLVMAGVGAAAVLTMAALVEPPGPSPPDNVFQAGSCAELITSRAIVYEVVCDDAATLVVRAVTATAEQCPVGTSAYRPQEGTGMVCVAPRA